MKKKEILVVCTHPTILSTILRLINSELAWHATGAGNFSEAYAMGRNQPFDLVLIGSGLLDEEEDALIQGLRQTKYLKHYGGGSGLLYAEIRSVFC